MIRQSVIAYWLIPAQPVHSFFQQIINDLARRYGAPAFEPHVTIHVGADRAGAAENALGAAARECKPVALTPLRIGQSEEFIKTVFVQFRLNTKLQKMADVICGAANDSSHYQLRPHLSLLYKRLAPATRLELAASIKIPFSEVTFDAVKALRCISPTKSSADVEAWQLVAGASLSRNRV